jgi:hypothetical protein
MKQIFHATTKSPWVVFVSADAMMKAGVNTVDAVCECKNERYAKLIAGLLNESTGVVTAGGEIATVFKTTD